MTISEFKEHANQIVLDCACMRGSAVNVDYDYYPDWCFIDNSLHYYQNEIRDVADLDFVGVVRQFVAALKYRHCTRNWDSPSRFYFMHRDLIDDLQTLLDLHDNQ
jgi:hypothetical protein